MPRLVADSPTTIYWLVDTSNGEAFYCGKSVHPDDRLHYHAYTGRRGDKTATAKRIAACPDGALKMHVIQVVPVGGDWREAERRWIRQLRIINPHGCTNRADGGSGVPGYVWSDEARDMMSWRRQGKPMSEAAKARLSATMKAKWANGEFTHKNPNFGKNQKGKVLSESHINNLRIAARKRWSNAPNGPAYTARAVMAEKIENMMRQLAGRSLVGLSARRLAELRQEAYWKVVADKKAA